MHEGRRLFRRAGGSRDEESGAGRVLEPGDGWSLAVSIDWHDRGQARVLREVLGRGLRGSRPARPPGPVPDDDPVRTLELRENREARAALLALFEALVEAVPQTTPGPVSDGRPVLVGGQNTTAAVNTVWAAAELFGPKSVPGLGRMLERALNEPWTLDSGRIRDACVAALAETGTEQALESLLEASRRAPTKSLREQILLMLERTERGRRMPPSKLAELHVSDHGLDDDGRRTITVRRHVFELILNPDGRVEVVDRDEAATPNAAAQRVAAGEAHSLRAAYRRELTRIEALLATERSWAYDEWCRAYLDNPITRTVAARLVWRMQLPGGRMVDMLPTQDGGVSAARPATALEDAVPGAGGMAGDGKGGRRLQGSTPESVRLWHPRDAEPAQLAAWRKIRDDLLLVQPFEQIDRAFTRADPDPDGTEFNQYAAVVVPERAFDALLEQLGWHSRRPKATATADAVRLVHRDFPDDGLSIAIPCRDGAGSAADEVVLGTAWFHRAEDRGRTPLALGYVPPRVYSEALRDMAVLARAAPDPDDGVADAIEQ